MERLVEQGVSFALLKNPKHRIQQLLYESKKFETDRVSGWALKGESAVDAALSDATSSEVGDLL